MYNLFILTIVNLFFKKETCETTVGYVNITELNNYYL